MKQKIIKIIIVVILILPVINSEVTDAKENEETQVPDYVNVGDILHMDFKAKYILLQNPGLINDHIAIYIGENQFVHSKHFSKVEIKSYDYFIDNYENQMFGYVITANNTQKEKAATWAKDQVGKRYQNFPKISSKGKNNRWYNSELVWYAYNKQEIDIDADSDKYHNVVTINEIINDNDTETYITHPLPGGLQKGDIILMDLPKNNVWNIKGYSNDHACLYMGPDFKDGSYVIHAGSGGVSYVTYDAYHFHFVNFTFFRVNNANESQRNAAVEWAVDRLGCKYQFFFPESIYRGMWEFGLKCDDINKPGVKTADRFYCMEIVWASYYNQGIDIDRNGWEEIYPEAPSQLGILAKLWHLVEGIVFEPFAYVNGDDIIYSQNTTQILI